MKRLPKTVKIGGHTITIQQRSGLENMGEYEREKSLITLEKDMDQSQKAATLLHEILHVILTEMHPKLPAQTEEGVVTALEVGLFAFIKDNPKVVRYLEGA